MAPFVNGNTPVSLSAPNDTVLIMQDLSSPWEMDLNTSVTIIFGILGLIFQAWQICYGRRQMARMPLQNDVVQSTETVFEIPEAPMPQRGQTVPPHRSKGSPRSLRLQQRPPIREAPPIRHARQPDRMVERCTLPPPPDNIRKRNAPHYSNQGRWGGASGFSHRVSHLPQYNNNQKTQYFLQGYEA